MCVQDLNKAVLQLATMPNVSGNAGADISALRRARFLCGDFASACSLLAEHEGLASFDLILTSESIYNVHSAQQILDGCSQCLKPGGQALVAAKQYYFGVGGSVATFKEMVSKGADFDSAVVRRIDDGASNVREVLMLTRRSGN